MVDEVMLGADQMLVAARFLPPKSFVERKADLQDFKILHLEPVHGLLSKEIAAPPQG